MVFLMMSLWMAATPLTLWLAAMARYAMRTNLQQQQPNSTVSTCARGAQEGTASYASAAHHSNCNESLNITDICASSQGTAAVTRTKVFPGS
jgi:hypothetical protein